MTVTNMEFSTETFEKRKKAKIKYKEINMNSHSKHSKYLRHVASVSFFLLGEGGAEDA